MKFSNKLTNLIVYLFIIILSLFGCSYSGKITYETCQDVCDGLIGYYPFFGNANDVSGNKNHGKVVGAQLTSDRNENQDSAYLFNGIDSYIELPNLVQNESYTLIAIVKVVSIPERKDWIQNCSRSLIISHHHGAGLQYAKCSGNSRSEFWYQMHKAPHSPLAAKYSKTAASLEKYFHVAVTANKNTNMLSLYRNGYLIAKKKHERIEQLKEIVLGVQDMNQLKILKRHALHGVIDKIRVYNSSLSAEEIKKIFDEW